NDYLFLLVVENLRPTADVPRSDVAWFSIIPERWRSILIEQTATRLAVDSDRVPFVVTRCVTALIYVVLAFSWAWRAARSTDAGEWLEFGFLTIAWFWLLLPTLNP